MYSSGNGWNCMCLLLVLLHTQGLHFVSSVTKVKNFETLKTKKELGVNGHRP